MHEPKIFLLKRIEKRGSFFLRVYFFIKRVYHLTVQKVMKEAFKVVRDVKLVKYTDLLKTLLLDFFLLLVDMQANGMS